MSRRRNKTNRAGYQIGRSYDVSWPKESKKKSPLAATSKAQTLKK